MATPKTDQTTRTRTGRKSTIERWVFWPAAIVILSFSAFALIAPHVAEEVFNAIQSTIVNGFNWYYVLIAAFFVVFALSLGLTKYGDIRLRSEERRAGTEG